MARWVSRAREGLMMRRPHLLRLDQKIAVIQAVERFVLTN